jgi:hypothetical protein
VRVSTSPAFKRDSPVVSAPGFRLRRVSMRPAACALVLIALVISVGAASLDHLRVPRIPASNPQARQPAAPRNAHIPFSLRASASAALGASSGSYHVRGGGGMFHASNAAQRLSLTFDHAAVRVTSGRAVVELGLPAVGDQSRCCLTAPGALTATSNRVTYRGTPVTAWYSNGPMGLEQGFTITRPSQRSLSGPLTLAMTVRGNTRASVGRNAQSVTFVGPQSAAIVYGNLAASDAHGRALHTWLQLSGRRLILRVAAQRAAYPLYVDPLIETARVIGNAVSKDGDFGVSVAVSGDGRTALVGAWKDHGNAGSAWVFTRSGSSWIQQGPKLTGRGEVGAGYFGVSVALSYDGNTALIGGYGDNENRGAAWVFHRNGTTWSTTAVLKPRAKLLFCIFGICLYDTSLREVGEAEFGDSVALSADGSVALIGGWKDAKGVGAAWSFVQATNSAGHTEWKEFDKLTGYQEVGGAYFGSSVALSPSATVVASGGVPEVRGTALVGGYLDGGQEGAAWTFSGSSHWIGEGGGAKLTVPASLRYLSSPFGAELGTSVALSSDGSTALIGGPGDRYSGIAGAGYVFTRGSSPTSWNFQSTLLQRPPAQRGVEYGWSVALSYDGNRALVGSWVEVPQAVNVFTRVGTTWSEGFRLSPHIDPVWRYARAGISVGLSADGTIALVGDDPPYANFPGAFWAFEEAQPPTVRIESPPSGGVYAVGEVVPTKFQCTEGSGGSGVEACEDGMSTSKVVPVAGGFAGSDVLSTGQPGEHTYSVVGKSRDGLAGNASISYTVASAPTVQIISPANGARFNHGEVASAEFACQEGAYGSGVELSGCVDSNGAVATFNLNGRQIGRGTLDTSTEGSHTYSVTVKSKDGQESTARIEYSVGSGPAPPAAFITGGEPIYPYFPYVVGEKVGTEFHCEESLFGPGLESCLDSRGDESPATLPTEAPGVFTYTVTAKSSDGLTGSASFNYEVEELPKVQIVSPEGNGIYNQNADVPTEFLCTEGAFSRGLGGCDDSNGGFGKFGSPGRAHGEGHLDTTAGGTHTYTVTATSPAFRQNRASIDYTVRGAPTIKITSPMNGQSFLPGEAVSTEFSCQDGAFGPGIESCLDSNGSESPGKLDTSGGGTRTYAVTAKSRDGLTSSATVTYVLTVN